MYQKIEIENPDICVWNNGNPHIRIEDRETKVSIEINITESKVKELIASLSLLLLNQTEYENVVGIN